MKVNEIIFEIDRAMKMMSLDRYRDALTVLGNLKYKLSSDTIVSKIRAQGSSRKRAVKKLLAKVL